MFHHARDDHTLTIRRAAPGDASALGRLAASTPRRTSEAT
jgi:hypothetical protein